MALISDLMEPFRPMVDLAAARLGAAGHSELEPETKRVLAAVISADMSTEQGTTPLITCLQRLALSLAQSFENGEAKLDFPLAPLPLDLADLSGP